MRAALCAAALLLPGSALAQKADSVTVTWGGFVDGYYAYRFDHKGPGDIPYLTQPGRHNEFNINLAYLEAKLSGERVRGRLAVQTGTSVAINYAGEPRVGVASGPDLHRLIQEAVIGYRLGKQLWLDGGIYLSHIGSESWISRDNWSYTRSLVADYSPYYESGVRLTWSPGKLVASFDLLNGWQNISENNSDKAVGGRLDYTLSTHVSVGYSNFIGNEAADSVPTRTRYFNDFYGKVMLTDRLGVIGTIDVGRQTHDTWWGYSLIARYQSRSNLALVARAERYSDPHQVIVKPPNGDGFNANGFSLGLDAAAQTRLLCRTELRTFAGSSALFAGNDATSFSRHMTFLVTSLALTL